MLQDQTAGVGQLSVIDGEFRLDVDNGLALPNSSSNSRFGQFCISCSFAFSAFTLYVTGIDVPLSFNISGPFGAPSIA
jgi:hypothetical protein